MKGKELIQTAVRAEMPDMEQMRENCIRQAAEKSGAKRGIWAKSLVPAAACAVVIIAAVFAFPNLIDGGSPVTDPELLAQPGNQPGQSQVNHTAPPVTSAPNNLLPPEFIGLPMEKLTKMLADVM